MDEARPTDMPDFPAEVTRTRFATTAAMVLERAWPLLLPFLAVMALFASASWFALFRTLPDTVRLAALAAFALAAIGSLYPLRFFRRPTSGEVDRRIERFNALDHAPLMVQADRPVGAENAFAQALWREHQRRMAMRLAGLGSDLPRTDVASRDPWALRSAVALVAIVAFGFSFGTHGGSIADGFRAVALSVPAPPRIDAWVTPPAYTGKPPVFLTAGNTGAAVITVPTGSDVSLRVTGGSGSEALTLTGADGVATDIALAAPPSTADAAPTRAATAASPTSTARQFAGKLMADGVLALRGDENDLARWAFAVTPDRPPVIRFTEEPKRAANGSLELHYQIDDDYGAASAKADFTLETPPESTARPLYGPPEMPLSIPRRGGRETAVKASRDLTEHVWAGSSVKLALTAVDDAGQAATTEIKTIPMPERPFGNQLAKAVVELRKILSLDANSKARSLGLIDAITLRPEDTFANASHYLGIMAGRTRLKMAESDDALRDVADYLWNMALQIEDGGLSDAEKRLREAQEALKQALRDGASDEQIDKLMQELRQSMNEFLREFAERATRDPKLSQQQPGQEIRKSDLEKMMNEIENLAKSGNKQQAEELLSQLQDMMDNLQAQRQPQPGENGQQSEMRQQMNKLGEIMRRQQEMMNETFRMDQMQRGKPPGGQGEEDGPGQNEQKSGGEGQPGGMTPQEFADALKQLQDGQGKLQGDLESLMKGLQGMGLQPGEGLGEAGDAMGKAEGALGDKDGGAAVGQQGRALEALRRGGQDMMKQIQAQQGEEGGSEDGGQRANDEENLDPLGRPRASSGPDLGNSVKVPDEIDVQRARQILEAIRKRLGNALSPELERSYLERLLEMR